MDALVDGEAGNLAEVGIAVSTKRADTVGTEGKSLRLALIYLLESFLAFHVFCLYKVNNLCVREIYLSAMFCLAPMFSLKRRRKSALSRLLVRMVMTCVSPGSMEKKLSL